MSRPQIPKVIQDDIYNRRNETIGAVCSRHDLDRGTVKKYQKLSEE